MNVKERKFGNARIYSEMTGKRGGCKETDDVEILIMARAWCRYSSVGARVHAKRISMPQTVGQLLVLRRRASENHKLG